MPALPGFAEIGLRGTARDAGERNVTSVSVEFPRRRVTGWHSELALPACGTLPKKAQRENRYG